MAERLLKQLSVFLTHDSKQHNTSAGGYVSINTGGIPDANAIPIAKPIADEAMDAAACIGCGACVAACKNGSAMLFVSAKVSQLALLPQGKVEAARRAKAMLSKMDELGFGNCTNTRSFTRIQFILPSLTSFIIRSNPGLSKFVPVFPRSE